MTAAVSAVVAGALLAACGGSGGGSSASGGPVHIKVWAWYPSFKPVVDEFNRTHKDVQVDWVQPGVGQDEYTKLKTVLKAGQGAPGVVMLEFQELPTIQLTKGLLLTDEPTLVQPVNDRSGQPPTSLVPAATRPP
ncbi:extracellular solute-binding protein [Spirillospora sp. CA-128828]|uniref:extracellular solute-binding protein n=1 Tax=Spirillospora sp. CA-128828 TaxID=3240033 RepID=UPI003D93D1FD